MKNIFSTKKLVMFYGLFLLITSNVYSQGVERWDIKTLNDYSAKNIYFNKPIKTTVKKINFLIRPKDIKNFTPRLREEYNVYVIDCKILDYIKQSDGDYHLIVSDIKDLNYKMIIEIITPHHGNKLYYKNFKLVRNYINKCIKKKKIIGRNFQIIGVSFFDLIHNQKGASLNYLELHPVLQIKSLQ